MTTYDPRLRTPAYKALRLAVLARDGYRCQIRGPRCRGWANQVDHLIPRTDGGDVMDPANLQAACDLCNGYRSALRTHEIRRYGQAVPRYETRL